MICLIVSNISNMSSGPPRKRIRQITQIAGQSSLLSLKSFQRKELALEHNGTGSSLKAVQDEEGKEIRPDMIVTVNTVQ